MGRHNGEDRESSRMFSFDGERHSKLEKGCIEIGSNEASHDKVTHSIETFLRIYFMPLWGFIPEFILLRIYFMSPSLKEGFIFNCLSLVG